LIFKPYVGYGAIFELSRVLNEASSQLSTEQYAAFNPGVIAGGTQANIDATHHATGYGKLNVIAKTARAQGDMRFISDEQKAWMKKTLETIVAQSLPKATSAITFIDGMPPMPPTAANKNLLAMYSQVSTDLGYPVVSAIPPDLSGGADISYVASITPANLSRLGPVGNNHHSVNEAMDIKSLNINTKRAAVLMYRLTAQSSGK
ncbi:MAG: M20/M25/M40 family metallo-hydrolase, partial [Gammaproteobacteria bacterium]